MSGPTTLPDCRGVMTATMPFDWRRFLARMRSSPSWLFESAMDRGRAPLCKSFGRGPWTNEPDRWRNMESYGHGVMVSTTTTRSCETFARNSTVRGREYDWTAPNGSNLGGREERLCPVIDCEEGDRREVCCLGRLGTTSSSS